MPAEFIKGKRYLNVENGFMVENQTAQAQKFNALSKMHLVNATLKVVRKDKYNPNSDIVGEILNLHLIDADDYFVLQLWLNSQYAKCFLNVMQNISILEEITIITSEKTVEGKKRSALFVKQNGETLKWVYTKSDMKDCPPIESKTIDTPQGPKTVYNDEDQTNFFLYKLDSWLLPALKTKPNPFPQHAVFTAFFTQTQPPNQQTQQPGFYGPSAVTESLDEDDLPF